MMQPDWFAARLLFELRRPDEKGAPRRFEDRIVLIEAQDEERAAIAAVTLGGESGSDYVSEDGGRVVVEFLEILDLVRLAEPPVQHATPMYWQYLDEQDLAAVRRSLSPAKFFDEGSPNAARETENSRRASRARYRRR